MRCAWAPTCWWSAGRSRPRAIPRMRRAASSPRCAARRCPHEFRHEFLGMNWLTNFVRPKIRALVKRTVDVPDNLWDKCPACGAMIFHRELEQNLRVCTHCGNHLRLDAKQRLALLLDEGFTRVELQRAIIDPLKFRDRKRYTERLKEAQGKTDGGDALLVADGTIAGLPAVVAVFEFSFMGGSMGIAVGDGLLRAAERAIERRAALI